MAITKNSQIDLNGNEMILDADGDTTITADTDDQIDFKTAGTDRVAIGASGNVGIGCTDAQTPLEIDTSTANYRIQFTHTSGQNQIKSIDSDHSTMRAMFYDAAQHVHQVSGTTAQTIDTAGIVTNPLKPFVLARRNGHLTSYNMSTTSSTAAIYNYVESGQSNSTGTSAFNTTTGRFTAPVAGVYLITASAYANVSIEQFWLTASNGSRHSFVDITQGTVSTSTAQVMTGTLSFYLAANESIGVHFYSSGDTAATIYDNNYHTYFRCVLIG